ncbi:MAG: hypothetical protein DI539_20900 [Flavobacterium psychrophilum]|nr:MAG: hypothetical protein DI539_20900 [Flavobacterium psychrophilum]
MKKIILSAAVALMSIAATSQIVYTDITDVSATVEAPNVSEFVSIDFNNDGTEEYNFRWDAFNGGMWFLHITFANNDDNQINRKEGSTSMETYVEPMNLNDAISSDSDWGNTYPEPFIGDSFDSNFQGLGDRYVGTKFTINGNVHYGWILVSFEDNFLFTVKSYAYQSTPNTPLNAGETGNTAGNANFDEDLIKMYPNPADDMIVLQGIEDLNIKSVTINDLNGRNIAMIDPTQEIIDISRLQDGIYILSVIDESNNVFSKKLVKQ